MSLKENFKEQLEKWDLPDLEAQESALAGILDYEIKKYIDFYFICAMNFINFAEEHQLTISSYENIIRNLINSTIPIEHEFRKYFLKTDLVF